MKSTLENLNIAPRSVAISMISPLVECTDWIVDITVDKRPFESSTILATALVETILAANKQQHLELFKGHPDLAGCEAVEGKMTEASNSEQSRLGLLDLEPNDMELLSKLKTQYHSRFGHPFIVALHRVSDLKMLFSIFKRRLDFTPLEEYTNTLAEIASVIEARTARTFGPMAEKNTH